MWIDTPLPGATVTNNIRRHDYTLTITKPDGATDSKHWDVISDTTSVQYYQYTPDQEGNYTLKFDYAQQTYTWNAVNTPGLAASSAIYENDTITAATKTITLIVQQEPVPAALDSYPLPTEYWTRPIEGQNTIGTLYPQTGLEHPTLSEQQQALAFPVLTNLTVQRQTVAT